MWILLLCLKRDFSLTAFDLLFIFGFQQSCHDVSFFCYFNFYWSTVDLQCCATFCCTRKSIRYTNTYIHSFLLLRNLYAGQEATVRTGHGTTDWFQIGKGVCQGCILSPCLFNLYAEYTMQNARLDEAKAGSKIARKNINNLRYTDDTTLMTESKEELKSLFMKVKEDSEKVGLKCNIKT